MSELLKLVDSLEVKVSEVVKKLESKEQINKNLQEVLALKEEKIKQQQVLLMDWEEKYNALKLTNSILGSEDYKRETKLKINALIKEIDHCIIQLSK